MSIKLWVRLLFWSDPDKLLLVKAAIQNIIIRFYDIYAI